MSELTYIQEFRCRAGSTSLYVVPLTGAGASGSPFTEVTSGPLPPRGPICWYRPDCGTVSPGFNPLGFFVIVYHLLMPSNRTHCRDRTCAAARTVRFCDWKRLRTICA